VRWLALQVVLLSGCALRHARLESTRDRVVTRAADEACGPLGLRRVSLGARWGEYVRVWVTSPTPIRGEARLHVDGRAAPLQRFSTGAEPEPAAIPGVSVEVPPVLPEPRTSTHAVVLDASWTNERLDAPAPLGPGHVLDVTLTGLESARGSCADVSFTVEQGVFRPNVDERAWVAELTRRGGPALQAWLAAEAARKEQVRRDHLALHEHRRVQWQAERQARVVALEVEREARQMADAQAEAARRDAARRSAAEMVVAESVLGTSTVVTGSEPGVGASVVTEQVSGGGLSVMTASAPGAGALVMNPSVGGPGVTAVPERVMDADVTVRTESVRGAGSPAVTGRERGAVAPVGVGAVGPPARLEAVALNRESVSPTAASEWATPEFAAPGATRGVGADASSARLEAVALSRESVSPSGASEWVTPEFVSPSASAGVAVTGWQSRPARGDTCASPAPAGVASDPTPALVVLDVLGALFDVAASNPLPLRVHAAVPARSPEARTTALPPPPPARAGTFPGPASPPPPGGR
jgi:hypothetical protein